MTSTAESERSDYRGRAPRQDELGLPDADPLGAERQRVQTAQRIAAASRARNEHLDPAIFGQPAWDMLLDLYIRETSGASSTIVQLLLSAQEYPTSTASRWLKCLEEHGVIRLVNHAEVGTELVELTVRGRTSVDRYLDALRGL